MKHLLAVSFCLFLLEKGLSQSVYLKIDGHSKSETKVIDSIGYAKQFKTANEINLANKVLIDKLTELGYFEHKIVGPEKSNDSTFRYVYQLGKKYNTITLSINEAHLKYLPNAYKVKNNSIIVETNQLKNFMEAFLKKMESAGFSLAKAQLINIQTQGPKITADLYIEEQLKRSINDIVVLGYDKFPKGHLNTSKRLYRNRIVTQQNLDRVFAEFNQLNFVKQTKLPEILFTKDSTKIFVYLEKTKSNQFDGFIGFSNRDENKLGLNGYIDLLLQNALHAGEKIFFYWKNDGNQQARFNLGLEVPFLFRTPLTFKSQINIFKQDSTFQNTTATFDLGYLRSYNSRIYLGYQTAQSATIQNTNNPLVTDYTNAFLTTHIEYTDYQLNDFIFPEKTQLRLKFGIGERQAKAATQKQYFTHIALKHIFNLNQTNSIAVESQNYYLKSEQFVANELFRFGGIQSIRGFNENSLQGNLFTALLTEYRYRFTSGLYAHSVIDYCFFEDQTTTTKTSLFGIGMGFGLVTKNGLFTLVYANGNEKNNAFKITNSLVHLSFKSRF